MTEKFPQYLTVSQAAETLGVGRNDMHMIPVGRWLLGPNKTQCYREDELKEWTDRNPEILKLLREKKKWSDDRRRVRENRYTNKGTLKKRFREQEPRYCPRCAGELRKETNPYCVLANPSLRNILLYKLEYTGDTLQVVFSALLKYREKLDEQTDSYFDSPIVELADGNIAIRELELIERTIEQVQTLKITTRSGPVLLCIKCFSTYNLSRVNPPPPGEDELIYDADDDSPEHYQVDDDVKAMTSRVFRVDGDGIRETGDDLSDRKEKE